MEESMLFGTKQAAKLLGVCDATFKKLVAAGKVPHVVVGEGNERKRRMFTRADLQAYIDANRVNATGPRATQELRGIATRLQAQDADQ